MGIKKFITKVTEYLGLEIMESTTKKKSLKQLLKKLNTKKSSIENDIKNDMSKEKKKELEEEYKIISIQIKKGEKILQKLISDK